MTPQQEVLLFPLPRPAAPCSPAQGPWDGVPSPPFPGTTRRYLALRPFLPQSPSLSSSRGNRPLTDPVSASTQSRFCVDVPRSPCLAAALKQEASPGARAGSLCQLVQWGSQRHTPCSCEGWPTPGTFPGSSMGKRADRSDARLASVVGSGQVPMSRGDTVGTLQPWCRSDPLRLGQGEVSTSFLPAACGEAEAELSIWGARSASVPSAFT